MLKLNAPTSDLLPLELQLMLTRTEKTILFVSHNVTEILRTKIAVFANEPFVIKRELDHPRPRIFNDKNLLNFQHTTLKELWTKIKKNTTCDIVNNVNDNYVNKNIIKKRSYTTETQQHKTTQSEEMTYPK